MHVLITGGAGFIGGHLTESLLADGCKVTVIDNYSTGSPKNLEAVRNHENLRVIEADVTENFDGYEQLVKEADRIYHLAAAVGVELVVHDPVRTILTNVHGTETILKLADAYHKRIIVASTSEVYGKSTHERFSETDDLLIGAPVHSRWSYACSKLLDEFYVMAFHRATGLPGTVVRLFNTVGPRQTGQYGMVVPRFVRKALAGEDLMVFGDGSQSRCFCHVLDTVRALKLLGGAGELSYGHVFNIGSHNDTTILNLAKFVIAETGSTSNIRFLSYDEAYEAGFEDMMRRYPDTSAIANLTGWKPERSLHDIVHDVAESLK